MDRPGIIFDFDGPLADTYRPGFIMEWVGRFGHPVTDEHHHGLAHHWGLKLEHLLQEVFGMTEREAREINDALETHDGEHHVRMVEQACETVALLADQGHVLTIVSSRERRSIEPILRREGIRYCFGLITGKEDTTSHKPEPAVFAPTFQFYRAFGMTRERLLFVGDTKTDIDAGRKAGLRTIIVETGPYRLGHHKTHPHDEDHIIPSVAHLPDWLERRLIAA